MMTQHETIAFLASHQALPGNGPVDMIETHGAFVFLAGDTALKLKRAVKYDYMDLSTIALRKALIARELELNKETAPQIYRDMLPVTREANGMLALDGDGAPVDWVLRMWRFPAHCELPQIVDRGAFDGQLATKVGAAIAAFHDDAPLIRTGGHKLISDILAELARVFAEFPRAGGTHQLTAWRNLVKARLQAIAPLLDARGSSGHVRRAHGDLHLRNIVVLEGNPVLYDALEFDETLGTCDILYDTAFLVMDLCHRGLPLQACRVLDAWLRELRGREDAGLAALPLFLSVRAAIRAMVLLQTDKAQGRPDHSEREVASYLDLACKSLQPAAPQIIAIGGYSGSGKSVLARALAPKFAPLPGAVLLSSDLERKTGLKDQTPLSPEAYSTKRREANYREMFARAETILTAGHSVVLDATFIDPNLRKAVQDVAQRVGVSLKGFWLDAPAGVLEARLRERQGDASDADVSVLRRQLELGSGAMDWRILDASGDSAQVEAAALHCR